ncbi:MAG: CDP-diacylglycerol--glycerol-3-phosphate 3-phosphatidyltransferase [Alphaproteobacteria bacterium]
MVLSLPNVLTLLRIALIPIVIIAFFHDSPFNRWLAAIVFFLACLTDFFDGYLARLWAQTSRVGQLLDPIADKLLVISTLFLLASFGRIQGITFIPAVIIIWREILVSGLREFTSHYNLTLEVSNMAKWKTSVQMLALGILLLGDVAPFGHALVLLGSVLLWIAALLTTITGIYYGRKAWQAAIDDKEKDYE